MESLRPMKKQKTLSELREFSEQSREDYISHRKTQLRPQVESNRQKIREFLGSKNRKSIHKLEKLWDSIIAVPSKKVHPILPLETTYLDSLEDIRTKIYRNGSNRTIRTSTTVLQKYPTVPNSGSWTSLIRSIKVDDDPILRYKPYFGDEDMEDVVSQVYHIEKTDKPAYEIEEDEIASNYVLKDLILNKKLDPSLELIQEISQTLLIPIKVLKDQCKSLNIEIPEPPKPEPVIHDLASSSSSEPDAETKTPLRTKPCAFVRGIKPILPKFQRAVALKSQAPKKDQPTTTSDESDTTKKIENPSQSHSSTTENGDLNLNTSTFHVLKPPIMHVSNSISKEDLLAPKIERNISLKPNLKSNSSPQKEKTSEDMITSNSLNNVIDLLSDESDNQSKSPVMDIKPPPKSDGPKSKHEILESDEDEEENDITVPENKIEKEFQPYDLEKYGRFMDSYRSLFCRRCFVYDCFSHEESDVPPVELQQQNSLAKRNQNLAQLTNTKEFGLIFNKISTEDCGKFCHKNSKSNDMKDKLEDQMDEETTLKTINLNSNDVKMNPVKDEKPVNVESTESEPEKSLEMNNLKAIDVEMNPVENEEPVNMETSDSGSAKSFETNNLKASNVELNHIKDEKPINKENNESKSTKLINHEKQKKDQLKDSFKIICKRAFTIFSGDYCQIAKVLNDTSCQEIAEFCHQLDLTEERIQKEVETYFTELRLDRSRKKKARRNKASLCRRTDVGDMLSAYEMCNHIGPCTMKNCTCMQRGQFCKKHCVCLHEQCRNYFDGCRCQKSRCRTKACPCFAAARECDPDICNVCIEQEGTILGCANRKVSLRKHKHLALAASGVPEAGWGIYTLEKIAKDDFIHEYNGELISQEEAERRGRVYDKLNRSYLFNLDSEHVIDATRKGNKTKFANHSKKPNCYTKVICTNGDYRIAIFALNEIQPHTELFFDYRYEEEVSHVDFHKKATIVDWMKDSKMAGKVSMKYSED